MKETTQQRIDVLCRQFEEIAGMIRKDTEEVLSQKSHVETLRHFDVLRRANDRIKQSRQALQDMADDLSTRQIPDQMRDAGVKTVTIEGVGRCTVSYRFSASMLDKDRGMDWLRETGNGSLIKETVNASSLSSFARDMIENEGKELPEDIFKTGTMPYTSITKAG